MAADASYKKYLLRGPTGTKLLSLVCHTESKMEVPIAATVVPARHPLLDGHTQEVHVQVVLCVPVKEWMRSGKHSERERYLDAIGLLKRNLGISPERTCTCTCTCSNMHMHMQVVHVHVG